MVLKPDHPSLEATAESEMSIDAEDPRTLPIPSPVDRHAHPFCLGGDLASLVRLFRSVNPVSCVTPCLRASFLLIIIVIIEDVHHISFSHPGRFTMLRSILRLEPTL